MAERYKAQSAEYLARFAQCCECNCTNCPFVPRHEGGTKIDEAWVSFSKKHLEGSYEDYLVLVGKSKTREDNRAG